MSQVHTGASDQRFFSGLIKHRLMNGFDLLTLNNIKVCFYANFMLIYFLSKYFLENNEEKKKGYDTIAIIT